MSRKTEGQSLAAYLSRIGVPPVPAATSPFDPGYDLHTLEGHLDQSAHLMATLKISMACWLIAAEEVTRRKFAAARARGVVTVTGGGPFEVAVARGRLAEYLDLCADVGARRVECGEGFTELSLAPEEVMSMVQERGLEADYEVGDKHEGAFTSDAVGGLISRARRWLDAGARRVVVEARESARDVGLFDAEGRFNYKQAERFAESFGLEQVVFEAPDKPSQFALIDAFGPSVQLSNVRLEELLRVEIYRRRLHSDAFDQRGFGAEAEPEGVSDDGG
jgi:phosphosulfolactate synthase